MSSREHEILERLFAEASERLSQARAEVDRLEAERYGLELALARTGTNGRPGASGKPPTMSGDPDNEWRTLDRTEAVHRVMREAAAPIHRKDILSSLRAVGRTNDTLELVGSTLAHLKKNGRVVALGGGKYAISDPNETDPAVDAGSVSDPLQKGDPDDDGHHRGHPAVMRTG